MRPMLILAASALALGLAACDPTTDAAEPGPTDAAPAADAAPDQATDAAATPGTRLAVAADGEGLRLVNMESGSTNLLPFGAPRDQAVTAIDAALGATGAAETVDECPSGEWAGPVEYIAYDDAGLTLLVHEGRFVGWHATGAEISTMDGIAAGSSLADVEASGGEASESTLGMEGEVSGVGFLLDDAGETVRSVYAGSTCFAR